MHLPHTPTQKSKRPLPLVLAYPEIYQRLKTPDWRDDFARVFDKCCELAFNRPAPENRHGGFYGLGGPGDDKRLHLYTVWAQEESKPDVFIIAGRGSQFGPDCLIEKYRTCPSREQIRSGIYGNLIQVPFL